MVALYGSLNVLTVASTMCHIACSVESKLSSLDPHTTTYLGGDRFCSFVFKQLVNEIVLIENEDIIDYTNCILGEFHISTDVVV